MCIFITVGLITITQGQRVQVLSSLLKYCRRAVITFSLITYSTNGLDKSAVDLVINHLIVLL